MTKANMKKYAVTSAVALIAITVVNRVQAFAPVKKVVYGG